MFATLVGPYPRVAGASDDGHVRAALAAQIDAGLGLLTDGLVSADAGEDVVDRWRTADSVARELTAARGLDPLPVKACLIGPFSGGRDTAAAVRALALAGAPVIQLDEDGLVQATAPGDVIAAAEALDLVLAAIADVQGAHICLAVSGGNADHLDAGLFFERRFPSYLFDLVTGPDSWRLIARAPGHRGIVCGAADARSDAPEAEAVLIWAARYAASLGGRGPDRVGLAPSAGLESLSVEVARAKIEALAQAARKGGLPGRELAMEIDPRAVDARSAALGRVEPRR